MNNNVVDSVIASIIFAILSTGLGIILQALGFSAQASIIAALFTLLALLFLFLAGRKIYPSYIRRLTERLLTKALEVKTADINDARTSLKKRIIERVRQENPEADLNKRGSIIEFPNQVACESNIREAFRNARKVKILTIRGEKYFDDLWERSTAPQ